jgi:hypothetical protein
MSQSTYVTILVILGIVLLIVLAFFGASVLARRATKSVIRAFRSHDALTPERAMTLEELGLRSNSIFQFKVIRDYKPAAINFLVQNNIVQITDDGKYFLSEDSLVQPNTSKNVRSQNDIKG